MKKRLYRLAALLLAAILLTACGKTPATSTAEEEADVTGRYYLVGTADVTVKELNEDNRLRLKDDGKAIYQLTFDQLEYKWKLKDDGTLTLTLDGEKTVGTLADGVITIRLDNIERVFVKGKSAAKKYIEAHQSTPPETVIIPPQTAAETTAAQTDSPATAATEAPDGTTSAYSGPFDPDIRFTGTDQYGNKIDENIFREHVLTMINFWEPWCGPCVGEMPELEQLYQDRGGELLIIGVYWTEENAAATLKETGVTYPVMLYDQVFERYQTGYVPTTIFVDPGGHVIGQSYIGARSYAEWDKLITQLIGH